MKGGCKQLWGGCGGWRNVWVVTKLDDATVAGSNRFFCWGTVPRVILAKRGQRQREDSTPRRRYAENHPATPAKRPEVFLTISHLPHCTIRSFWATQPPVHRLNPPCQHARLGPGGCSRTYLRNARSPIPTFWGVLRPLTRSVNEHPLGSTRCSCSRKKTAILPSSLAYRSVRLSPGKNRVYIYFRWSSCEKTNFGFSYTVVGFTARTIITAHKIPVRMKPTDSRIVPRYIDLHSRASIEDNPLKLLRVHW